VLSLFAFVAHELLMNHSK